MAQVGFGIKHFNLPTPANISRAVTILSVLLPVFLLWVNSDDNLFSEHTAKVINSLGVLIIGLTNAAKPFFGVVITQPTVPATDVTAIKT
jgi:hypothetical protein